MTSIRDEVERAIEEDFVLRDALARQVANRRGVARWLIEHRGIDSSVSNVASILKGYEDTQPSSSLEAAWAVMDQIAVSLEEQMVALVVRKRVATVKKLRAAIAETEVDRNGVLRFSPGRTTLTLVYEARDDDAVRGLFDDDQVLAGYEGLSELVIHGPEDALETPGILALITSALAARGIPVLFPNPGSPDVHLLIPTDDGDAALHALGHLTTS